MGRPDAAQLDDMCAEAEEIIGRVRASGSEVLRRANAGGRIADGYPTRSGPSSSSDGDGTSTPERLALAAWSADRLDDPDRLVAEAEMAGVAGDEGAYARRGTPDPVRRAANGMCASLSAALVRLREADGDRDQVVGARAVDTVPLGSRISSVGWCWVCGLQAHPLTAGMCSVCHPLWEAAGFPDRAQFRHSRVTALAAGRLLQKIHAPGPARSARLPAARETVADGCVLCGANPARGRGVGFVDVATAGSVALCAEGEPSCYERWVSGERPT